jgi:hypothetical protein
MRHVYGRILVQETGDAVPNVVVRAYGAGLEGKEQPRGSPIGSALTGGDGAFDIAYEPADKSRRGDAPLDLMIAVYAPDVRQSEKDPRAIPEAQRLMHVADGPRRHAASTEAYAIWLPLESLRRFGLEPKPAPAPQRGHVDPPSPEDLVASMERGWRAREVMAEHLREQNARLSARTLERRKAAKDWAEAIKPVPRRADMGRQVEEPGEDAGPVHAAAIDRGLARFAKRSATVRLNLTEEELKTLKLDGKDGPTGQVDATAVADRMFAGAGGPDLVRRRDFGAPTPSAKARLDAIKAALRRHATPEG